MSPVAHIPPQEQMPPYAASMGQGGLRARVGTASVLVMGLTVVLWLSGCGADVERQQAGAVADAFTAEVSSDPQAACALLAPRTEQSLEEDGEACARALTREELPAPGTRTAVNVAGNTAQVRYAEDTVFLSLFDDGWRVTAAGCARTSPDPAVPYDCAVQGS
ncbi:MAG TPA: hypothetical protein VNN23_08465 [Ornithinibacter sp.]|nr:hypothetical protein [Ornithinibacter sp.]